MGWALSDEVGVVVTCRPKLLGRVLAGALGLGMMVFAVFLVGLTVASISEQGGWGFGTAAIFGLFGALNWRLATLSFSITNDQVTIRNVVRTYRIERSAVRDIQLSAWGGGVCGEAVLHDGRRLRILAISKNQLMHALGRRGKADESVARLNEVLRNT